MYKNKYFVALTLIVFGSLLYVIQGCGSGTLSSGSGSGLGTNQPVSTVLGQSGGSLTSGTGTLTVPSNTVSSLATFTIGPASGYPTDTRMLAGSAYAFDAGGAYLQQPVTLTISYSTLPTTAVASSLVMYTVAGATWKAVSGSTLNTTTKTVSASVQSAGTYAIFITQSTTSVSSGTILLNRGASSASNALAAMYTDGSNYHTLLTSTANSYVSNAHFSPAGATIFYDHTDGVHGYYIYSINSDGTSPTLLTGGQTKPDSTYANSYSPAVSSDGTTIAFVSDRTGTPEVFTMTSTGGTVTQRTSIVDTAINSIGFTKSGAIAFNAIVNGISAWYQVPAAGGTVSAVNYTPINMSSIAPWTAYNSAGTLIAASYQVGTGYDLYTFVPGTTAKTRLTTLAASAIVSPRFTSDGLKVVFQATINGAGSIFVVNNDGSGLTNLTSTNGPDVMLDLH